MLSKLQIFCAQHRYLSCFIAGAIAALSMPPWHITPFLFLGFSFLIYRLQVANSAKQAFTLGWCYGFGYFLLSLYWIGNAVLVYADEFWWAYPFALIGLPLILALFYGFASMLSIKLTKQNTLHRLIAIILLIGAFEWARGHIFTGFPWNSAGLMWIDIPAMSILASIGGLELLSAITLLFASLFYLFTSKFNATNWIVLIMFLGSFLSGVALRETTKTAQEMRSDHNSKSNIHVIIVQPNIPQIEKWDPAIIPSNLEKHMDLTREALLSQEFENALSGSSPTSTIIIWPETAMAYYIYDNKRIQSAIQDLLTLGLTPENTYLLTGVLDKISDDDAPEPQFSNAMIGLSPDNPEVVRYGKHHLVPFGEYMPFAQYLSWTPLVQISGFVPALPPAPLEIEDTNFSFLPLICYEIIFPIYSFKAQKANAIINITNDAWYGDSAGPVQHLALSRFRAIEQSKPVFRSANTGISAFIDPYGNILESLEYGQDGAISINFTPLDQSKSLYSQYGSLFLLIYKSTLFGLFLLFRIKNI